MSLWEISAYVLALFILIVICRIFFKPLRTIFKLVLNSVIGGAGLFLFNILFESAGFTVALNAVTASVCGILGVPGLLMLIALKLVCKYI